MARKLGTAYWVLLISKGPWLLGEFGVDSVDSGNYMNWEIIIVRYVIKALALEPEGNSCGSGAAHLQRKWNSTAGNRDSCIDRTWNSLF